MTIQEILTRMHDIPSYEDAVNYGLAALREHHQWTDEQCTNHTYTTIDLWDDFESIDYKATYRTIVTSLNNQD